MLKALVRAYRNNLGMYERSLASVDGRAGAALLLLRSSGTERDRQLPIGTRSWLENPGTPRPTGDVALQERSEIFDNWWKLPARESDLRKLKGHYGVD